MDDNWQKIGDAAARVVERLVDTRTRTAIEDLVDYMEDLGRLDGPLRDTKPGNIFESVRVVRHWLNAMQARAR
jgi:hypothetical protein